MTDIQLDERVELRKRITTFTRRAARTTKSVVAIGGLILVILLQIPWMQSVLSRAGFDNPTQIGQVLIVALLVAVFSDVRLLMAEEKESAEPAYFNDPMDVYPALLARISKIRRPEEKRLDVIGMTLYTAWPSIRFWLQRPEIVGWTISMTAVMQANRRPSASVPAQWYRDALVNLESIRDAAGAARSADNTLHAYGYDFTPAIHGFRLGSGDLYWSALRWGADGKVSMEGYSYEYVPGSDRSPAAEAKRAVFESWFRRSCQTAVE